MRKTDQKHEIFAREWVIDHNGTRAAIAAGYSEKGAEVRGSQLLTNSKVQRWIKQLNTARASKLAIKAERIDEEVMKLAFANMGDYVAVDEDGKAKGIALSEITREQWAAVQEIKEDTAGGAGDGERKLILRTTLKLSDKTKNLELLYRRLGLLKEKVEHSGLESIVDAIAKGRKAVEDASNSES